MYEKIKHYLKRIFNVEDEQKILIETEYTKIMKLILAAKTLSQLFNARAELIKFNELVKQIDSPFWAKNKIKFLEAKWNRQYRLWKARG